MPEEKYVSGVELKERLKAMQVRAAHAAENPPHKHLQLRQVEVFIEVVAHGTVSKAAAALGLSTSSVSQTVSDLEQNLGTSLFEHDHRRMSLTPAGKLVAEKGKELLAVEAEIRNVVAGEVVSPRYAGQPKTFASKAPIPRRDLRQEQNAGDVLATVAFIEGKLPPDSDVQFPKALTDELERILPDLGANRESIERMGALLDVMQVSVTPEDERVALLEPANRASTAFHERYEGSERVRARQSRDPSTSRRR